MKILLVIPAHGQNNFLPKMLDRLSKLTTKPAECKYIIDRPAEGELEEAKRIYDEIATQADIGFVSIESSTSCPEWVGRPQMYYGTDYFLTGHVRNNAVKYAMENNFDGVVFIDGDCVPEPELIESHMQLLDDDSPIATVGRRREVIWNMEDQRMASPKSICHLFADKPTLITNEFWIVDSGVVWTCNFGLNAKAIERLCMLNKMLYGRDEVFSSDFSGTWGGEDGFIGMECFYGGIPIYALPNGENGIVHQPHTRPLTKYDHPTFLGFLEGMREDLLLKLKLHGLSDHPFTPRLQMKKA